jgi:hypothetical protein
MPGWAFRCRQDNEGMRAGFLLLSLGWAVRKRDRCKCVSQAQLWASCEQLQGTGKANEKPAAEEE